MTENRSIPILRFILAPTALVERVEAMDDLTVTRLQLVKAVVLDTTVCRRTRASMGINQHSSVIDC